MNQLATGVCVFVDILIGVCVYVYIKKRAVLSRYLHLNVGIFGDGVISSSWLSHSYEWPVLSPGYYESLDVIVVSRLRDPSITFVFMCHWLPLWFFLKQKKNPTQIHKIFVLCDNIFFTLTQLISYWLEVFIPGFTCISLSCFTLVLHRL